MMKKLIVVTTIEAKSTIITDSLEKLFKSLFDFQNSIPVQSSIYSNALFDKKIETTMPTTYISREGCPNLKTMLEWLRLKRSKFN